MRKLILFAATLTSCLLIMLTGCHKDGNHLTEAEKWHTIRINIREYSETKAEDPFKKLSRIVAGDVLGALAGAWIGGQLTANPYGVAAGAVIVGAITSYGASRQGLPPDSLAIWIQTPFALDDYEREFKLNSGKFEDEFLNSHMILHNQIMVKLARLTLETSSVMSTDEVLLVCKSFDGLEVLIGDEYNFDLSMDYIRPFIDKEGLIDVSNLMASDQFDGFNFDLINVYLENLSNAQSIEDFLSYSLNFEELVEQDSNLSPEEILTTKAFCALGRASYIYWYKCLLQE